MLNSLVSASQFQQLERDGFFVTDRLFSEDDVRPLRDEFDALSAGMGANKAGGTFTYGVHKRSARCREFLRHDAFASLCRDLLGPHVYQTWNQMIVKRPGTGGEFAWHQDGYYGAYLPDGSENADPGQMDAHETLTFWIALTDATVENGCLWALPGEHRRGLLHHTWNESGREWVGTYDVSSRVPVELKAGQALVFTRLTPHCSGPNMTSSARIGYQIGYGTEPGVHDRVPFLRDGARI